MTRRRWLTIAILSTCSWTSTHAQVGNNPAAAASATADAKPVWAGVSVANVDVSATWYQENLGFKVTKRMNIPDHNLRIVFLELNGFTLELVEFRDSLPFAKVRTTMPELKDRDHLQGFVKLGFQIGDVDRLAGELKRSGIKLRMEPTDDREFHDRFFLVEDPDGNTLQFFQKLN